jgi:hypothetical protein
MIFPFYLGDVKKGWTYQKDGPAKSDKPAIWDGQKPMKNGKFAI